MNGNKVGKYSLNFKIEKEKEFRDTKNRKESNPKGIFQNNHNRTNADERTVEQYKKDKNFQTSNR